MYGVSWLTFQNWIKKVEKEVVKKQGTFTMCPKCAKSFNSSEYQSRLTLQLMMLKNYLSQSNYP
jgi:response regulator of citrate/malate metabolism